jgi:hypothetical protein
MEVLDLPVLPIDAGLSDGIGVMQKTARSGVLGLERDKFWLFKANAVRWGRGSRFNRLLDLPRMYHVYEITPHDISSRLLDVYNPYGTATAYESLLDDVGRNYAILLRHLPSVRVSSIGGEYIVTRHEDLKREIGSGPQDCYCLGPRQHGYPPPNVSTGDYCKLCGAQVTCG